MSVFLKGKEMAEEEDEVAVGMEKGFMDEFFEQVGSFNAPGPSIHQRAGGIYSSHVNIKPHVYVFYFRPLSLSKMTPPMASPSRLYCPCEGVTYRSGKSCINACIFECVSLFVPFKYAANTKRARLQLSAGLLCSSPTAIELVFKMLNNSAASGWRMWEVPSIWNGFSDFCLNAAFTAGRNTLLLFFFFL